MNKDLQNSLRALTLIENIMTVRGVLRKGKFDANMFEQVNGDDRALESLVGHDVTFEILDDASKVMLRREIMNKLTENLIGTYGKLRASLENYFGGISTLVDATQLESSDKSIKDLSKISDAYKAALPTSTIEPETGCYTAVGVQNTIQAFEAVTEFINKITPVMTRIYADAIEKQESEPAEVLQPAVQQGSEAAPAEPIQPEPEINDPDHQVFNPAEQDEDALGEIKDCALANRSMENCQCHFVREAGKLQDFGYATVESIAETLKLIAQCDSDYVAAVKGFLAVFPVTTCVQDDLTCISNEMLGAIDAVVDLIKKSEGVRVNLKETNTQLLNVLLPLEGTVKSAK